jgi:hypothetical protein
LIEVLLIKVDGSAVAKIFGTDRIVLSEEAPGSESKR